MLDLEEDHIIMGCSEELKESMYYPWGDGDPTFNCQGEEGHIFNVRDVETQS